MGYNPYILYIDQRITFDVDERLCHKSHTDEPLTRSELFKAMAQSVGRRRLLHLPGPLMRLMTGVAADMLNRSQRVSSRRFKELTGWQPSVPDARAGWQVIAEASRTSGTLRETAPTSHA